MLVVGVLSCPNNPCLQDSTDLHKILLNSNMNTVTMYLRGADG